MKSILSILAQGRCPPGQGLHGMTNLVHPSRRASLPSLCLLSKHRASTQLNECRRRSACGAEARPRTSIDQPLPDLNGSAPARVPPRAGVEQVWAPVPGDPRRGLSAPASPAAVAFPLALLRVLPDRDSPVGGICASSSCSRNGTHDDVAINPRHRSPAYRSLAQQP